MADGGPLSAGQVLSPSQNSASGDPNSLGSATQPCKNPVRFRLVYDDPWKTPVTDVPVRLLENPQPGATGDVVVIDGERRTSTLKENGLEDGDEGVTPTIREKLGVVEHRCIEPGFASFETIPDPGAEAQVRSLEGQILTDLGALEQTMNGHLSTYIADWNEFGWMSVPAAYRSGFSKGVGEWWSGEKDFWASIGEGLGDAWDYIEQTAVQFWNDYAAYADRLEAQLPPHLQNTIRGEILSNLAVPGDWLVGSILGLIGDAQELWEHRDDFLNIIRSFVQGSIDAIEGAIKLLVRLTGEIGTLFREIADRSIDWVQGFNELLRQSGIIQATGTTLGRVLFMMKPNFWATAIGTVAGYLLPEVLITIILMIIGAICAAVGASALALRIGNMVTKLSKAWARGGKALAAITSLFTDLKKIFDKIGEAAAAARKNVDIKVRRATNREHEVKVPVTRQSGNNGPSARPPRSPTYRHGASDGGPGEWGASNRAGRGSEYQEHVTGAPNGTEYKVPYSGNVSGEKWMDGYDPERNVLVDAKDWDKWPPTDRSFPSVSNDLREAADIARETGVPVEWRVPTQTKADQLLGIVDDLGLSGVDVVAVPK